MSRVHGRSRDEVGKTVKAVFVTLISYRALRSEREREEWSERKKKKDWNVNFPNSRCCAHVSCCCLTYPLPDQTTAHTQKVSCLDIGETGRVLVTGGADRLVNLFAIGNDKSIQVSSSEKVSNWKVQLWKDDRDPVASCGSFSTLFCFALGSKMRGWQNCEMRCCWFFILCVIEKSSPTKCWMAWEVFASYVPATVFRLNYLVFMTKKLEFCAILAVTNSLAPFSFLCTLVFLFSIIFSGWLDRPFATCDCDNNKNNNERTTNSKHQTNSRESTQ